MAFISITTKFLPNYSPMNIYSETQVNSSNTNEAEVMLDSAVIKNNNFDLMFF